MANLRSKAPSFFPTATLACMMLILPLQIVFGQGCVYQYLKQPPSVISCNPYSSSAILKLQCQASVPIFEASVAELQWFYNDIQINASFPPLMNIEAAADGGMITSTIELGEMVFDDTFMGDYFCQIAIAGNISVTAPSRTLVLQSERGYITQGPCRRMDIQVTDDVSCAGNTSFPEPPATDSTSDPPSSNVTSSSALFTTFSPDAGTNATRDDSATSPSSSEASGSPLQVWVYVLVAIAAVFGMIIVVLTILCVGLCLKKNKTEDTYKQKDTDIQQFTSNSMVSNGIYQRKGEGGVTSGTHVSSHSQISDHGTLRDRDYEVIDVADSKRDYHHLQRPSPPMLPSGRNATFSFAPTKEFHSMSTLTSQLGKPVTREMDAFPGNDGGPEQHVYRELEMTSADPGEGRTVKDIYHSPTDSDSAESPRVFNRGPNMPTEPHGFEYRNESLYSPNFESSQPNQVQQGGLGNMPETGAIFDEPDNPMAFPTHNYETITQNSIEYETPINTRKKSSPPLANSQSNEGRPRADSSARYEMQTSTEESQYSKLTRPSVVCSLPVDTPVYSELRAQISQPHDNIFSQTTEMPKPDQFQGPYRQDDGGFTVPSHVGVSGCVVNRGPSVSSATDSLASYIAHLQSHSQPERTATFQIDDFLFEEIVTSPTNAERHHLGCERKTSLEAEPGEGARKNNLLEKMQKRALSEERGSSFPNGINRLGFTGFVINNDVLSGRRQTAPQKIHRDLHVNGLDTKLGECARSKTMV